MNTSNRTDQTLDLSNETRNRSGRLPNIRLPPNQTPKTQILSKTPQAPKAKHFTSPGAGEPARQTPSRTQLGQPQQEKLDEPSRIVEDSKRTTAHSFDLKQQKFHNFIKEELMSLFNSPLNKYIYHNLMGGELDNEELREKLRELGTIPKFTHGKVIAPGEPYFRCLDCEVIKNTGQRTYLCRMCFEKKSHKGHRFLLFNDATGNETCDCGNIALLDNRFFCPDHGNCSHEDYNRVLDAVPNSFMNNFNKAIKTVMYEIIFACEVQLRGMQSNIKAALNKAVESMASAFQQAISHNPLFLLLIAEAITDKVAHPKSYKGFLIVEEKPAKSNNHIVEESLSLTYLEALMRYSLLFKDEVQKQLRELFLKLACVEEFNKRLVLSFHNVVHHLFKIKPQNAFVFSNIAHLTTQIYASEENCLNVIEKGSFLNIIDVLRQYGKFYEPTLDIGSQTLNRILHLFELILEKETPGRNFVQKGEVTAKFLDVLVDFQNAHTYDAKNFTANVKNFATESNIIDYWNFEAKLLSINEKLMRNVGHILDQEGWDHRPELFLIDWGERAIQDMELKINPDHVRLNIPLQRAMIAYLQCSLERIDSTKIMAHLEYIRRSCPAAIEHLICQTLSTIGVMRKAMIQIDGWNIDSNKAVERYFIQDGLSFFDYDFAFVQLFSLLLNEDDTDIFAIYYKNFFAKDDQLIKMFEEGDFSSATSQQMLIIEDFLDFTVQVLHGEISFFNIFYKAPYLVDHGSKKTFDQIHRKILINFLHKSYQHFPITPLKHDFRYILRADIFHEKILKDIADVDKASKNFKLKKAYTHLFDSYYLYPDRIINSRIIANVRAHNNTPEIAELGNFAQSLPFLNSLQQLVYEGHIIEWCDKVLTKYSAKAAQLIPSIVKIIIMPLKLLEHNKKAPVTKKIKQNVVFPLFGSKDFLEKMKKVLPQIDDTLIASPLAKLVNIFIPTSTIGSTINVSAILDDPNNSKTFLDPNMSMDPNIIHENLLQMQVVPQGNDLDEKDLLCGVCRKPVDLTGIDVGIPAYISRSNVNYWELKGRKFRKPFQNGDEDTVRLIVGLLKRYSPYAGGLHPKDIDFLDDGVPINYLLDFYPALTSCMHYMHRTCFSTNHVPIAENSHEYECPICKKLNNMFIGMEKVDAASRKFIEDQIKKNKRFLDFLRKQAVTVPMLPDSTLKFDFYNSFMHGMFPKNPNLELKPSDPSADKKILKFVNLIRASYFQLVRNSLINDFQTFMARSYLCYKFAFVNLQSFIMKNFQFHQFFENFDKELSPTIFHILNHKALMQADGVPTMQQIYDTFKEPLGLEQVKRQMKRKEDRAKKAADIAASKHNHHHEHTKKLPELPPIFKNHKNHHQEGIYEMTKKNKDIMMAYNYKNNMVKMGELMYEDGIGSYGSLSTNRQDMPFNLNGTHDSMIVGSVPDVDDGPKEEDLFDLLQKMMLLFENDTEEDFLLAFWETFLRFIVTNRMKDFHTNLDLTMLPIDFLYLRTLNILGRTMISEKIIKQRQTNLPEFDEICEFVASDEALRASFIEEMIGLTQRIIVSCILIFDFDKCLEISNTLDFFSELQGNRENFLNTLLGLLHKDLTVSTILSVKMLDMNLVYKNFFYAWRENLRDFMGKTRNPFELFAKNIVEVKPLVVELPSNFNEFNSEYLPRKCDKCQEFCEYCKTVLCLLCGKIMCKDKCRRKPKKTKRADLNQSIDTHTDTNSNTDDSRAHSIEASFRGSPPVAPVGLSKFSNKNVSNSIGTIRNSNSTARLKTMVDRTDRSSKEIMTFDDNMGEASPSKAGGALSSIFRPGDFQTPKRNHAQVPNRGYASENPKAAVNGVISSVDRKNFARGSPNPNELGARASPKDFVVKKKGKAKTDTKRAVSLARLDKLKGIGSKDKLDMSADTDSVIENSINDVDGSAKKKRKKRKRLGNMTKHADKCHKGHTVFIDIQDQSVILFSKPREVIYPEKLYVDRFGQALKDKINIVEEDWNSFELNPFVLKKLREAVENHSLPQLIYLIIKNHYKPNQNPVLPK